MASIFYIVLNNLNRPIDHLEQTARALSPVLQALPTAISPRSPLLLLPQSPTALRSPEVG